MLRASLILASPFEHVLPLCVLFSVPCVLLAQTRRFKLGIMPVLQMQDRPGLERSLHCRPKTKVPYAFVHECLDSKRAGTSASRPPLVSATVALTLALTLALTVSLTLALTLATLPTPLPSPLPSTFFEHLEAPVVLNKILTSFLHAAAPQSSPSPAPAQPHPFTQPSRVLALRPTHSVQLYHFTGHMKPWFSAHCVTLDRKHQLVTGPGDARHGPMTAISQCPGHVGFEKEGIWVGRRTAMPIPGLPEYIWWRLLRDAVSESTDAAQADALLQDWGVLEAVRTFRDDAGCRAWQSAFPGIVSTEWCDH